MQIVSTADIRRLEQESALPLASLMQNAGEAASQEILLFSSRLHPRRKRRFSILAGKGNNGGDALAVASILHGRGLDVSVFSTIPLQNFTGTAQSQAAIFPKDIPFHVIKDALPCQALQDGSVIIDGLLGIGIKGNAKGVYANAINQVNESGLPVISLDAPSGLDCDTGLGSPVIRADLTVTMAFPKQGMFRNLGPECCGLLRVALIGLPQRFQHDNAPDTTEAFTLHDAARFFPRRPMECHKYSFGHALCLAGSSQYPGAPVLAAAGALRSGAGLVTLAMPGNVNAQHAPWSLISVHVGESDFFTVDDFAAIARLTTKCNAILYGPGTGPHVQPAFLADILRLDKPTVIDADGLRLLASEPSLFDIIRNRKAPTALTPHPGEMAALANSLSLDCSLGRLDIARQAATIANAFIVLKGHQSVCAAPDGRLSINSSGGPMLATAGTGDVLAGLATGFLAQGIPAFDALRLATFIHGLAGELYPFAYQSMIADDLLELIPQAMSELA